MTDVLSVLSKMSLKCFLYKANVGYFYFLYRVIKKNGYGCVI